MSLPVAPVCGYSNGLGLPSSLSLLVKRWREQPGDPFKPTEVWAHPNKVVSYQLDQFSSPTHSITQAFVQVQEAGRGTCLEAEGGCSYPSRDQDTLQSVQSDHETSPCTAVQQDICMLLFSIYKSLCSGLFSLQFSHIDCSELVIVGELFCRLSEAPSRVKSSARFKGGVNCFLK